MADRIWISWNEQRRNIGMAAAVRASLFMTDRGHLGWFRLVIECIDTWKIVRRERPSICFTMNPSIFSSLWLSLLAPLYGFRLITDLHTPNIELRGLKNKIFQIILKLGIKRSDMVIVTNEIYRNTVLGINPNVLVIPDPLPELNLSGNSSSNNCPERRNKKRILFVCSFDQDEPLDQVLAIDPDIDDFEILVSGNWEKMFATLPITKNVRFLGFVPRDEYDRLLLSSDGVMVLTVREGCLCCGAYEAFSAGKPLILSDTAALREFFGKAPIYTDNISASILKALRTLKIEKDRRAEMICSERERINSGFRQGVDDLERMIAGG